MVRIGGERPLVPGFGTAVASELAAGIAEERGHIGVVVVAERAQRRDAADVVAVIVDERVCDSGFKAS
jgi:hypothetical protein